MSFRAIADRCRENRVGWRNSVSPLAPRSRGCGTPGLYPTNSCLSRVFSNGQGEMEGVHARDSCRFGAGSTREDEVHTLQVDTSDKGSYR